VRRLLVLVCAIVLVDTMLYAALVPLLPGFADDYGLSKTGAGLLVAAYAAGVLVGALPGGIAAARFGPRTAALAGLLVIAAASLGFAFASDEWSLGASRLVQGLGSALSWSGGLAWLVAIAPRERRGEMLGTALAGAIVGALLGPVVGGVAALAGTKPTFVGVGALAALLAFWALRTTGAPPQPVRRAAVAAAFRERRFVGGLWLMLLPSLLLGVLAVLVPLDLAALGWGAVAIGGVYLVGAAVEAGANPFIGRLIDRRGVAGPVRAALIASVTVSIALAWAERAPLVAALAVVAGVSFGALLTPGLAILSDGADRVGLSQGVAFGLMNAAWAAGNTVGPSGAGAVGDLVGDAAAYGAAAALCALTLVVMAPRRPAAVTPPARVPTEP
jgi:MFS family permease